MNQTTELQQISEQAIRFMRGKYALDEVACKKYGADCLKFKQGKKTILTITICDNHFDFLIIFGKEERAKYEKKKNEFSKYVQNIYDNSNTFHDGKWMNFSVDKLEQFEAIKGLIVIKKKPNRKPFPKENAIYSDCGHRCDLCIHYVKNGFSDEMHSKVANSIKSVYKLNPTDTFPPCNGCNNGGLFGNSDCEPKKCAKEKGFVHCTDCKNYDCGNATVGLKPVIEARNISAEDVTWAILPFVEDQYGN